MLKISSDKELAAFLGLGQSAISTWKARNKVDFDLIFEKVHDLDVDLNYLVKGEEYHSLHNLDSQIVNDGRANYIKHTRELCPQCLLRERLLASQEETIALLKARLSDCEKC